MRGASTSRALTPLACVAFAFAVLAPAIPAATRPAATKWVPIELERGHIHVPVAVAGVEERAVLDTGSTMHLIDREFAEAHGVIVSRWTVEVSGVHSTKSMRIARRVPVRVFGSAFELRDVVAGRTQGAALLLGLPFLRSFVTQIDFPGARMRMLSFDALDLEAAANVPLRREAGTELLAFEVRLDGERRWLTLDTGNGGSILLRRGVAGEAWPRRTSTTGRDVHGKLAELETFSIPKIEVGPYALQGLEAQAPRRGNLEGPERVDVGVRSAGLAGYELLRHFVVTLDVKHRRMHIALPRASAEPRAGASAPASE